MNAVVRMLGPLVIEHELCCFSWPLSAGVHVDVAGRLASEYVTVTNLPTECGYQGLPVRGSVPRMPVYLRFGIGGCEEYSAATTVTMPRGTENPFLDTPDAAFCATGAPTTRQAWLGFFGVALLVGYSIWLRWYIQHRGKCADTARLTAADYAILLTGLRTNEEVDGKEGLQEKLYQDLEELGFARRQIDHIAFGARCRKQIKILREIAGMNVQEQELKAKADEDGLAKLQAKRQKLVGKFELVIEGAALSTGQAVVVFKAESDRVSFQNALEKGQASRLRLFWSSTATPVLSRSRSAWAMVPLRFEAAPEPDAIVWENLELGDGRELAIKVLGLIGVAGLLVAGGLLLIKLKDLAALLKADESGGLAVLSTVAASPTRGEASGAHALLGIIFELFDVFVGVPFDQAIHRMIAYLQGVGLPVSRMKLVLSLTCAVVVGLVNAITKAFIKVMARLQGLDTLTELEGTLFSRLSLVLVANTVVVPFAVEVVNTWRVSGGTAIVDQSWYEPGGVISTGISLVIIDALAKFPLLLLPPGPFVKRILSLFPRFATSHGKIFKLWEPPELMAAENYAALITSLALCLLYAPFFPPLYLISAAGLALNLWSFKVAVIKWYKRPPSFNEEMGETLRKVVSRLVLPVHLVSFYLSMVNASFDPPLVPVYAAMGLGCGYIVLDLFVLPLLPAFQDYNQLSGSGDSMGINYDEVAAHAKYEVDFYAFPRLRSTEELDHIIRDGAPLRISRTPPTANKNVLSAVKVCQLAQEPWIDLGANVEDESAPPSTDVAKHYRTMPIVGIKWDAPAGGVAPRSPTRADKDEAAALL